MTPPPPPVVGAWLLERAGIDEAIAGDLAEQFAFNRSARLYWREVMTAIAVMWLDTIRTHKWLAVRAILTGWVVWALLSMVRSSIAGLDVRPEWTEAARALIRYGNWVVIGWTIGMLHRPYQNPMVLAYVVFMLVMSIPSVSHTVVSVFGHPSYNAPSAAMVALAVVSLIAGGLLSGTSFRHLHRPNPQSPPRSAIG